MTAQTTSNTKFLNALRWLILLPAAVVVGLLAGMVGTWLNHIGFSAMGISEARALSFLFGGVISGAVFVYVGTQIAPRGSHLVPWLLAAFSVLYLGMVLLPLYQNGRWLDLMAATLIAASSMGTAWGLTSGFASQNEKTNARGGEESRVTGHHG